MFKETIVIMKKQNIISILLIIFVGFIFTSCSSDNSELEEALAAGNDEPTVNLGDEQSVELDDTVQLNANKLFDPDGKSLDYSWEFIETPPGSKTSLSAQDVEMPTFIADIVGIYKIRLTVYNGIESKSYEIEITAKEVSGTNNTTNTVPVANAGDNFTVTVNNEVNLNGNKSFDADPEDQAILTYSWHIESGPDNYTATLINSTSAEPTFTPDEAGFYEISLTVNDGKDSHTDTIIVTASTGPVPNNAPVAIAGDNQVMTLGSAITLNGTGSSDPDGGDTLEYLWEIIPFSSNAFLNNSAIAEPQFTADMAGTYEIRLTVDDGSASNSDTVTITVNTLPVASAGANQAVALNDTVTLDGSGSSDLDSGDTITYLWAFVSRPDGSMMTLTNATTVNPTFSADVAGTFEIQLTVSDTKASHTDTVSITTLNTVPVANAGEDQFVVLSSDVTLYGSGSLDEDREPLTYLWAFITRPPGSMTTLTNATTVNPTFTADVAGTYEIRLTVSDTKASHTNTVLITTLNTVPIADAGNSAKVLYNSSVTLDGGGSSDTDGNVLSYAWKFLSDPTGNTILNDSTTINPSFAADALGTYLIELIVNDGYVNSSPATVEIVVARLSTSSVPDTGQNQYYNAVGDIINPPLEGEAYYGQDGTYVYYKSPSYTKLDSIGNELPLASTEWVMVKDNVTGLIWEVKTDDGSVHDRDNVYTWYDSDSDTNGGNAGTEDDGTHSNTEVFINSLNSSSFGGYNAGWRLPTMPELQSIVNYGETGSAIDSDYFMYTMPSFYWSSMTFAFNPDYAWHVYFGPGGGGTYGQYKSTVGYVRAVRGIQATPSFTNNNDGTITDNNTGLMWMQDAAVNKMNWEAALRYCETLTFATYSDWRLPNAKELRSIVDYNNNSPADIIYFPDTVDTFHWSSTTVINNTDNAWTGAHYLNHMMTKYDEFYARAVRGGQ